MAIQINHPLNIKAGNDPTHHRGMVPLADMYSMKRSSTIVKSVIKTRQGHKRMGAWSPSGAGARQGPWNPWSLTAPGSTDMQGYIEYIN